MLIDGAPGTRCPRLHHAQKLWCCSNAIVPNLPGSTGLHRTQDPPTPRRMRTVSLGLFFLSFFFVLVHRAEVVTRYSP